MAHNPIVIPGVEMQEDENYIDRLTMQIREHMSIGTVLSRNLTSFRILGASPVLPSTTIDQIVNQLEQRYAEKRYALQQLLSEVAKRIATLREQHHRYEMSGFIQRIQAVFHKSPCIACIQSGNGPTEPDREIITCIVVLERLETLIRMADLELFGSKKEEAK
ncbi:hypothetical protein COU76_00625 [Candidatus Peregrinibacteria bacterium CG10_big_fil_rev_8_21_14_0_10_49_10]|nr:MAG: hypothetical protein COU76_00625 [Candidatus Peregrinibacteria bacterium CG10_big_fil_rev_8_21_14_0_10_49_10]